MLGLVTTYEKENEKGEGKGKGECQNGVSEVGEWGLRGVFAFLQVTGFDMDGGGPAVRRK